MRSGAQAEKLRVELSAAFETQGAELEALKGRLAEMEAKAREEAAQLRGQAEALTSQHADLMRFLQDREGERPGPKGGKNGQAQGAGRNRYLDTYH